MLVPLSKMGDEDRSRLLGPSIENRHRGLLAELLNFVYSGKSLLELEQWESRIKDYGNESGKSFEDHYRLSVITHRMKASSLREHLRLNASRFAT